MKKAIRKFWGIGLVVIILSSLFVSAAPASGNNYAWGTVSAPSNGNRGLSTTGIADVTQTADGATIYAVNDATSSTRLLKSTNGGVSWAPPAAGGSFPSSANITQVAVAPDDANFLVVVAQTGATTFTVYLSTNGGSSFSALTALTAGTVIRDLTVSPLSGSNRYIVVVGYNGTTGVVYSWKYGDAAPSWTELLTGSGWTTGAPNPSSIATAAFSPAFASDQALLIVSANGTNTKLSAVSYNTKVWDASFDATFPRILEATGAACTAATISLDPTFYFGDTATQIGFVGAAVDSSEGGVYRISSYTVASGVYTAKQIMTDTDIASVAWDGTNLVAAPYTTTAAGAITIYRSADALSATNPSFQSSSSYKTPSTGTYPQLIWNGSNVLCVSRGQNGGVARSADLGKSFNGIALLKTSWTAIADFNVSADGSVIYVVANDGTDTNVFRKTSAWERVMIIPSSTANWMIRTAMGDPTAVFLGLYQNKNMYVSTDSGETKWLARSCSQNIADFAVETKDIVYVVANGSTNMVKSTNGAFTWGGPKDTMVADKSSGSTCYSVALISAGNLVVGGTAGGVAYSSDGGSTWAGLHTLSSSTGAPSVTSTQVVATASGLATGDVIYATSATAGEAVYKWVLGTNTPSDKWTVGAAAASGATGMVMANGVLYAENSGNVTGRWLTPNAGPGIGAGGVSNISHATAGFVNAASSTPRPVNALQVSMSGTATTLWGVTTTALYSWTEYLTTADNGPTTIFPTAGYMVPVNSISGATGGFTYQWNRPSDQSGAIAGTQSYTYTVEVYLDAAGKVRVGQDTTTSGTGGLLSIGTLATNPTYNPGTNYYWRVKTTAPVSSPWSPMVNFTIESIAAAVPSISSPVNGSTITNQTPAFSWTPITGTTSYQFQLASNPTFGTGTILIDNTSASAGYVTPSSFALEQGVQYFWRVRAIEPVEGEWSAVGNFLVAAAPAPAPVTSVVVTQVPAPTITIPPASPVPAITLAPQPVEQVAPAYIWAIIIIGGVLVIAVIVLIVRTRRSV